MGWRTWNKWSRGKIKPSNVQSYVTLDPLVTTQRSNSEGRSSRYTSPHFVCVLPTRSMYIYKQIAWPLDLLWSRQTRALFHRIEQAEDRLMLFSCLSTFTFSSHPSPFVFTFALRQVKPSLQISRVKFILINKFSW